MSDKRNIIDVHTHIFPVKLAARAVNNIGSYYGIPMECDGTAEGLLESKKELPGMRFVISSATLKPDNLIHGNDFLLEEAAAHPEFIPFSSFFPFTDVKEAEKELIKVKSLGSKGIKLHPDFQRFNIDDDRVMPIYEICDGLGLPILFHVGDEHTDYSTPTRLRRVADNFPGLKVIAAHLGGYKVWDEACQVLIGTGIYTEVSDALTFLSPEKVVETVRRHGTEKIMFGSDFPLVSPFHAFEAFEKLPFTEEEKEQIYHKTAETLFGI